MLGTGPERRRARKLGFEALGGGTQSVVVWRAAKEPKTETRITWRILFLDLSQCLPAGSGKDDKHFEVEGWGLRVWGNMKATSLPRGWKRRKATYIAVSLISKLSCNDIIAHSPYSWSLQEDTPEMHLPGFLGNPDLNSPQATIEPFLVQT